MKKIYFLIAIAILVIIGVAAYFLMAKTAAPSDGTAPWTNPFGPPAATVPVATSTNTGADALDLMLQDGTSVAVQDFTKVNQPPTANATSGYQVAGSDSEDFQILYYPQNSGILISIFAEPIGPNRTAAEAALRATLGLTDAQLCKLTVDVRTTRSVNETFGGRNLGLSFCPGATTLPQ